MQRIAMPTAALSLSSDLPGSTLSYLCSLPQLMRKTLMSSIELSTT